MPDTPPPPPPSGPRSGGTGLDKQTSGLLCYLFAWLGGLFFLFTVKDDPDIKYNGAQSVVFLGGLTVIVWFISILGGLPFMYILYKVAALAWLVGWAYCIYKSWTTKGQRFEIPVVGKVVNQYAEQLYNAVR